MASSTDDLARLSIRFRQFAEQECRDYTPLYEQLALGVSDDRDLLSLAALASAGQPAPNLLLAAVHFLLLSGARDPLAAFYPSLTVAPDHGDPFPAFRRFCLFRRTEIAALLTRRAVQTNEVGRAACLLPAFAQVHQRGGSRPLFLVEVGASAGLLLLWDQYGYRYPPHPYRAGVASTVQLSCQLRGLLPPPFPPKLPAVAGRVGVDLNPLDARDPDAALWLRALVWPEHHERAARLSAALRLASKLPPSLVRGDALIALPPLLDSAPTTATVCVFHCHTLNQFSQQAKDNLASLLLNASNRLPIFRLSYEGSARGGSSLTLTTYDRRRSQDERLADCGSHGQWLQWLLPPRPLAPARNEA